jgi:hypothetical protein
MKAQPEHAKRGRPPKFGRRGQVIAVTLPEEVVRGLRKLHEDLGWAIVTLFEKSPKALALTRRPHDDAELVTVGGRRSLIVVNKTLFNGLPGVSIMPLHGDRAFLALAPGRDMSDLELAVIDRLAAPTLEARERQALMSLRTLLRKSRKDRNLRIETRAIIVLERLSAAHPRADKPLSSD